MSQSLSRIYIHGVFHIRYNSPKIQKKDKEKLYAYMGSIIKDNQCIPIIINGVENHVHILFIMSKNIALSAIMEQVKKHSSRWMKTLGSDYDNFGWQGGYGGFSVSQTIHNITKKYIENQEEHHRKITFKEEYLRLLQEYGVDYNEDYLWSNK
jgi:REP element-mobilizing transposase RayT